MPGPDRYDGRYVDLSGRFAYYTTVDASPSAGTETIIATLPTLGDVSVHVGVKLECNIGVTIGTSGVTARLRVRQTNVSGAVKADSGVVTVAAASLYNIDALGIDLTPTLPGQVYVATLLIGSGAATSTVTPLFFSALII